MNLAAISNAVAEILAEAEADILSRRPVCHASGKCCKFEEYGHRLYVTAAELIHFGHRETAPGAIKNPPGKGENPISLQQFFAGPARGCPYQVDNLCTARAGRPLGCRVYFCDQRSKAWQEELYEKYHLQLKEVHERFGLPYRYVEWRVGLRELSKGEAACE